MKKTFLIFLLFNIQLTVLAQEVALVLSGGGAKGLAHVSILKELEKNQIPIDYIVGTSMGAIVGGFYAAGYSPEEIEQIVLSRDFQNWINGKTQEDYNYHYFTKNPDPSVFTISFDVEERFTPALKSTLAEDAVINYMLTEYLATADQVSGGDFDRLYVPFRAIGADIFTQTVVVLEDGILSEAVRASMAVPFFYKPVRVKNDKLLFDGGIYNNFPVDVARKEFDPDVIIAVNVSTAIFDEYPYENDEKLIEQSLLIYLLNKSDPSGITEKDIYVEPDLKGYGSTEFFRVNQFLDSGTAAITRKMPEILGKIEKRTGREQRKLRRMNFHNKALQFNVNSVQFRGFTPDQVIYLRNLFQLHKKSNLTVEDIRKGYFKLVSEEYFREIYPKYYFDPQDSSYIFELEGKSDPVARIDFGGYVTSRNFSELYLGLRFNSFDRLYSEHALQLYTGSFYQSVNYYSRFNFPGKNIFYIEPQFTYNKWDYIDISDILFNEKSNSDLVLQNDFKAGINSGFPLGSRYRLNIHGYYLNTGDQFSNTKEIQSNDILDELKFDGLRTGISVSSNSLNRKLYPDLGGRVRADLNYFYGKERYFPGTTSFLAEEVEKLHSWLKLNLSVERYYKFTDQFHGGWMAESTFSNQPLFSNFQGTILNTPVFYPLNDSRTMILPEYRAFHFLAGGLRSVYKPVNKIDIRLEGYVFKALSSIEESEPQVPSKKTLDDTFKYAGTLNTVYHSPIGPVSVSLNYYDHLANPWGVMFHIGYMMFNNKAMH